MSEIVEPTAAAERPRGTLRRELRVWEAFAISIGIMAPTAAMALNGVAPAGIVGRAVPLAFLLASIAIALVSYAFIRLTSFFNHAGSAYALAGVTLGRSEALWRVIVPILAIVALVFVIYKNVWPRPAYPYDNFPLMVGGWLLLGILITLFYPGLARRVGIGLSEAEGIKASADEEVARSEV